MSQHEQEPISQLYHSGATEMPSDELDDKILANAKRKLVQSPAPSAKVRAWRKWQWPVSIAASVLLVSVLFVDNLPEYAPQQDRVSPDASQLTEAPVANSPFAVEEMHSQPEVLSRTETKIIEDADLIARFEQMEQQQDSLAKRSFTSTSAVFEPGKIEQRAALADTEAFVRLDEQETLPAADNRVSLVVLDEPFLTALVDEVGKLEQELTGSDLSEADKRQAQKQLAELHQEIYDELYQYRRANPVATIPEKYLSMLSQKQRRGLDKTLPESK